MMGPRPRFLGVVGILLVSATVAVGCVSQEEATGSDTLDCRRPSEAPWQGFEAETQSFADNDQAIWGQAPADWSIEHSPLDVELSPPEPEGSSSPRISVKSTSLAPDYEHYIERRRKVAESSPNATIVDDRNLTLAGHEAHCLAYTAGPLGDETAFQEVTIQGTGNQEWTVKQKGPVDASRELGSVLDRVLLSLTPIPPEGRDARNASTPTAASLELLDADGDGRNGWMAVEVTSAADIGPLTNRDIRVGLTVDGEALSASSLSSRENNFLVCRSPRVEAGSCEDQHLAREEVPPLAVGDALYVGCRGNGTHELSVELLRVEVRDETPACEEWKAAPLGFQLASLDEDGDGKTEWITLEIVRGDASPYKPRDLFLLAKHGGVVFSGSGNASASSVGVLVCRTPAWEDDRCKRPALGYEVPQIAVGDRLYVECVDSGEHRIEVQADHNTTKGKHPVDCGDGLRSR